MTLEKRLLSASAGGFASFVVSIVQSVALVPLFLTFWGSATYGVWLSLSALFAVIITADAGYQYYIGNELCRCYSIRHVEPGAFKLALASGFRMATLLALFEISATLCITGFGFLPMILGVTKEVVLRQELNLVVLVMVVGWIFTGPFGGILNGMYLSTGLLSRSIWIGVITRTINVIILGSCVLRGYSFLTLVVLMSIVGVISLCFIIIDLRRRFPDQLTFWQGSTWSVALKNFKRSLVFTFSFMLTQLQGSGLLIRITTLLSTSAVPAFTTTRTLGNTFIQCNSIIMNPLAPEMIRYNFTNEYKKLINTWVVLWWGIGGVTNVLLLISLFFIEPLYIIWTHGKLPFQLPLYLLIAWLVSLHICSLPLVTYLNATNNLRAVLLTASAQTFTILGVATLLLKPMGLIGAGVALIMGELLGPMWLCRYYTRKQLNAMGGKFPIMLDVLSLVGCSIVGLVFMIVNYKLFSLAFAGSLGIALLTLLYAIEWFLLPSELQERVSKFISMRGLTLSITKRS